MAASAMLILWVLSSTVAQGTSRVVDGDTKHPIPLTRIDELDKEQLFIENFEDTNPEKVGDKVLFEADILLTDEQWKAIHSRKAIDSLSYRWSEGSNGFPYVPYVFEDSVDQDDVRAGINHWMEHTCIKFEETTNTSQPHLQFHIGSGCWSYIGMLYYRNGQQISIGYGCNSLGIVVHEIGHAMGLFHEQSRSDRDDHVVINYDNIREGTEGNFGQSTDNDYGVTYDYSSDMHYSGRGFTTNGLFTIVTLDPFAQELIGQRTGLSHRDILLANTMYGCLDKWLVSCGISSNPCQNEGFIGANCTCVCPVHTSGASCETVNEGYYDHLRSDKTEVITTKGTISEDIAGDKFTKHIIAPECKTPQLVFKSFNLYPQSTLSSGDTYCYYEYLNIRTSGDLYNGEVFCGTDIAPGQVFSSSTREMILFTESRYYGSSSIWTAELTFNDVSDCTPTNSTTVMPSNSTTAVPSNSTTAVPSNSTTETLTTTTTTTAPVHLECKKPKIVSFVPKGETVIFTSPKFPMDYPKSTKCGWMLKKPSDGSFVINCDTFELEKSNKKGACKRDFLKIKPKKSKNVKYCGNTGPSDLTIQQDKVVLDFKTNRKNHYKGFSCTATVV